MRPANKWLLLTSLYFSQGLPFGFFTQALPVLMREEGASLSRIGLSGILFLPWALKWLWAPWVDAYGTRRGWIIPLQLASIVTALLLAGTDGSLHWLKVAIVLSAVFAATQDVPTDALAVNLLQPEERGLGNAVQVGGYRLGMVLGGGLLMVVLDQLGWAATFVAMAAFLTLSLWPLLRFDERLALAGRAHAAPRADPLAGIWLRLKVPGMAWLLLWLMAYKFGDAMASAMVKPLLVDAGWSKSQIGLWVGGLGSSGGLLGAMLGGWMADAYGRRRALLLCGIAQTLAVALYAMAVAAHGDASLLKIAVALEHLLGGMATVALFTLMMDACDPAHGGTDYSLQACAVVVATGLAGVLGGVVGDALGFGLLFVLAAVLSAAGCALLLYALARGLVPERLRAPWRAAPLLAPAIQH